MCVFRGIQTSFCGVLMLLSTALTGKEVSFTVRIGDEVTLPCGNLTRDQLSCDRTAWHMSPYPNTEAVELITDGKISNNEKAKAKSKRLRVTADCSLVITNVTQVDVGRYTCRQFTAEREHRDFFMHLSIVNTEDHDAILFYCTVMTYGGCWHKVQWLYEGDLDDIERIPGTCTDGVTLETPPPDQKTVRDFKELLKCEVTDERSGRSLQIKVSPQSSAEEKDWWPYAAAAAGVAALLITVTMVMMLIRRKKTKGIKTQRDGDTGQSLKPAESGCDAESGQEKEDPGEEVSYASVSYTKKTSSKTQAADGDAVTYSTVKVSSAADQASVDPSSLYATVHRAGRGEAPE